MFRDLLSRCASVTPEQAAALEAHYELLCRWNKILNLTTVDRLEEAVERHYCESWFLAKRLPERASVVDVGSGAGFPGFVVAVARPFCTVTLVEAHQRKAVFLREASRGMKNVRVRPVRAEAVQEKFDWLVSRAVSYEDLRRVVPRLAARVALLSGAEDPVGWSCDWEVVPLPSGNKRFLRLGVSRETTAPNLPNEAK